MSPTPRMKTHRLTRAALALALALLAPAPGALAQANLYATVGPFAPTVGSPTNWDSGPAYHPFVIALDRQRGVALAQTGDNTNLFDGATPWVSRIDSRGQTRYLAIHDTTTDETAYEPVQNPLAMFGGIAAGTPLMTGGAYSFGCYAGGFPSNAFRIRVYEKSAFASGSGTVLPVTTIAIPIPLAPAHGGDTNAWGAFVENGFRKVVDSPDYGLRTVLDLVDSEFPSDRWGLPEGCVAYRLTHAASSDRYCFLVEQSGFLPAATANRAMAVTDTTQVQVAAFYPLYAMEFEEPGSWSGTFLDRPTFDAEPMPSAYNGKTIAELLVGGTPPALGSPPDDPATCTNLDSSPELRAHPALDRFVEDMTTGDPQRDALALAEFVLNEIELADPLSHVNFNGYLDEPWSVIKDGGVNRGALGVFLERQGSPTEICALMVYLLRRAGIPAVYVVPSVRQSVWMFDFQLSRLLRMQLVGALDSWHWEDGRLRPVAGDWLKKWDFTVLPRDPCLIAVEYPWVAAHVGGEWRHIFPWMADTEVVEGYDLYDLLAPDIDGAQQWVERYVKAEPGLLALSDVNTPAALFPGYVRGRLAATRPDLSIDDIGVRHRNRKHHYDGWDRLPHPPLFEGDPPAPVNWVREFATADNWPWLHSGWVFDHVQVKVTGGGQIIDTGDMRAVDLNNRQMLLRFEKRFAEEGAIGKIGDAKYEVPPAYSGGPNTTSQATFSIKNKGYRAKMEFHFEGNDEDLFDVEPDDYGDVAANAYVNITIKLKAGGEKLGWKKTKLEVEYDGRKWGNAHEDKQFDVGGLVIARPDVDMILSLEAFREQDLPAGASTTFANATSYGNPLLVRQAATRAFTTPPSSLDIEMTHKRHRGAYWLLSAVPDTSVSHTTTRAPIIRAGDMAAICLNFGRVTPAMLRAHAEKYWRIEREIDANKGNPAYRPDPEVFRGTAAYLMGMSYFERVSRYVAEIEALHKTRTLGMIGTGLGKFSAYPPHPTYGFFDSEIHLIQPNVDMFLDVVATASNKSIHPDSGDVPTTAWRDLFAMIIAGGSAEEHQVLNSYIAGGDRSISTVRLLQLAAEMARSNPKSPPIVELNSQNFAAKGDVKYGGKALKDHDPSIWTSVTNSLVGVADLSGNYTRVLMTPGAVDGAPDAQGTTSYRGVGALLLAPNRAAALISGNLKPQNGGYTFSVPQPTFAYNNAGTLSLQQSGPSDYRLQIDTIGNFDSFLLPSVVPITEMPSYAGGLASSQTKFSDFQSQWAAEVLAIDRMQSVTSWDQIDAALYAGAWRDIVDRGMPSTQPHWFEDAVQFVFDPVSVLTGEFYHDAEDLVLPGPMPLVVRRNYASQNLADNHFGYGWKLAHFPCLAITASNTIYAAEMDGSVVAYAPVDPVPENNRLWKPRIQDNPTLNNVSGPSNDGVANMYLASITNYMVGNENWYRLDSPDGSRRLFRERSFPISADGETIERKRPYLETWQDSRSNVYSYGFYEDPDSPDYGQLRRIESSSGNFVGFYYDPYGHITEAFTGDGRRLYYRYDDFGDLVEVTLPDNSYIRYGYEHRTDPATGERYSTHLIVREEKPDGRVVENIYDDETNRRVVAQLATVGPDDTLVTNATFQYSVTGTNEFDQSLSGQTIVRDALGRPTTYTFDGYRLTGVVDPLDQGPTQEWYPKDATPGDGGAFPGGLKKTIDRRGLETTYAYDARGNVTNTTVFGDLDGDGAQDDTATTLVAYNALGVPTNRIDPLGIAIRTHYEDNDYPYLATRIERVAGGNVVAATTNTYTEASDGSRFARGLLASSGSGGNMSTFAYDARGFPTNSVAETGTGDPAVLAALSYNDRGEVVSVTDAAGNSWRYAYDGRGNRTAQERHSAAGGLIWWQYDYYNLNGELEWTDGPRFNPEDYVWRTYDGGGRPRSVTRWRSGAVRDGSTVRVVPYAGAQLYAITSFAHDELGNLTRSLDPNGNLTVFSHDAVGRVTGVSHYDGPSESGELLSGESFTYEPGGEVHVHTGPLGGETTTLYSSRGLPRWRELPDDTVLEWRYDLAGRPVREPVSHNNYWAVTYDDANRTVTRTLKTVGEATLASVTEVYDARGNLVSRTDEAGFTTTSTYDGLDRLKTVTGPPASGGSARQSITNYYHPAGLSNVTANALGEKTIRLADALGRPIGIYVQSASGSFPSQTTITYSPDHNSSMVFSGNNAVIYGNYYDLFCTTTFSDTFGNPVATTNKAGLVTLAEYDAAGNQLSATDEASLKTRFAYDGLDRLIATARPDNTLVVVDYDAAGNVVGRQMPGSLNWSAQYDAAGRITHEGTTGVGGGQARTRDYTYHTGGEAKGLLHTVTDGRNITETLGYDSWRRLQSRQFNQDSLSLQYRYEERGLLTNLVQTTSSALHGASASVAVARAHDGYGQVTAEETRVNGATRAGFAQAWDAAGRRDALDPTSHAAAPTYDFSHRADGKLTSVIAGLSSNYFAFTASGLIVDRTSATPNVTNRFLLYNAAAQLGWHQLVVGGTTVAFAEAPVWYYNDRLAWSAAWRTNLIGGDTPPAYGQTYSIYGYDWTSGSADLTGETFINAGGGLSTNLFGYFRPGGQSLDMLVSHRVGETNHWVAEYGDWWWRITQESRRVVKASVTVTGLALGAASVALEVDGQPPVGEGVGEVPPVVFGGPMSPDGLWHIGLSLEPGEHTVGATAILPSGMVTNSTNVTFTVTGSSGGRVFSAYDGDGNQTGQDFPKDGIGREHVWDGLGRLVAVRQGDAAGDGWAWVMDYDGLGRRIGMRKHPMTNDTVHTSTVLEEHRSHFDPEVEFLELGVERLTSSETNGWWKVYGPDLDGTYGGLQGIGGLEAVIDVSDPGAPVVAGVIDDMLGNPVATVSAGGVVSWNTCVVGGYGPQPGWTAPALSASAGPARASVWRGRRFDPDTGYCWLGARFYDPAGHRYLSPDPLGHAASLGLYDYAGGDPVNFVDPDGRLVVGAAEGYVFGNWSADIDSVDRPGRILGRAAGTMLGYMTPGYNVVAGYRDIAAGGFHFGRAIYGISVNGLNQETGIALAMSGLELAGGFAGTRMFGAFRAGSSEMAFARASSRPPAGYQGGPGAQWIGENLDDVPQYSKLGTGGQGYRVFDTGLHRELSQRVNRAPGFEPPRFQSHHPIQKKWAVDKKIANYDPRDAPTIILENGPGKPHSIISGKQRRADSGAGNTLRQEFNRGYRDMIDAGVDPRAARRVMKKNYKYFVEDLKAPLDK